MMLAGAINEAVRAGEVIPREWMVLLYVTARGTRERQVIREQLGPYAAPNWDENLPF